MSNFFKEVEFEDTVSPAEQRAKLRVVWDEDMLKSAFETIQTEIDQIKGGTHEMTTHAIQPSSFGFPAENAIKVFVKDPSDRTFEGIEEIGGVLETTVTRQDLANWGDPLKLCLPPICDLHCR